MAENILKNDIVQVWPTSRLRSVKKDQNELNKHRSKILNIISENKKGDSMQDTAENTKTTEIEGQEPSHQICKNEKCKHNGALQIIDEFRTHPSGKRIGICNTCMSEKLSAGHAKRKAKKGQSKKPSSKPSEDQNKKEITINFTDHTDVYESLIETAKDRVRTPENLALWMFVKIHEKGLKTFPELSE